MSQQKRINKRMEIKRHEMKILFDNICSGQEIDEMTLITEGLSTTNYIVSLKHQEKKYLVKIYPLERLDNSIEYSCMSYLKDSVNIPDIHIFDASKTLINYDYLIMDYIEGNTLSRHVKIKKKFDNGIAHQLGSSLSRIHCKKFDRMGLLCKEHTITKTLIPISKSIKYHQTSHSGSHLSKKSIKQLDCIDEHYGELLGKFDCNCVLSHGDFNPNNIIVDKNMNLWFIDFEYSMSAPRYMDIGKLFRKRPDYSDYITADSLEIFINGYRESAEECLSENWLEHSKVVDITSLLSLINRKDIPQEWIQYVEQTIEEFILRNKMN